MGLRGGLDELPLTDLIGVIALGRKTGRLRLLHSDGSEAGHFDFREGRLTGAVRGALTREKAFYALLSAAAATFDFDPQAQLDDETCNLPTETLLMEGTRRIDEIRRLRQSMPAPATVRFVAAGNADADEARVLAYLGPGARAVGDIIEGLLVAGDFDEYDALRALARLNERGIVRVEVPHDAAHRPDSESPQAELEA